MADLHLNTTDSCKLVVVEPTLRTATWLTADSVRVGEADAAQLSARTHVVSDSISIQASDIIPGVIRTAIPLHILESVSIAIVFSVSDNTTVGLSEQAVIAVTAQAQGESARIGLSDSVTLAATLSATESLAVVAGTEAATLDTGGASINFIAAADTCRLGLTEPTQAPEASTLSVSDSAAIAISLEDPIIFGFVPQQFVTLSVADTCVVQVITLPANTIAKTASDILSITLTEPFDQLSEVGLVDALAIQEAEGLPTIVLTAPMVFVSVAEAISVRASDVAAFTVESWFIDAVASEVLAVGLAEAVFVVVVEDATPDSLSVALTEVTRTQAAWLPSDLLTLQASERTGLLVALSALDAITITVLEAVALATAFVANVTDTVLLGVSEAVPTFPSPQPLLTSDTSAVQLTEDGPLIASVTRVADVLQVSMDDASLLLLRFLAVTDAIGLPATESATLFSDFIQTVASDTARVAGTDTVSFVQEFLTQLTTTESLALPHQDGVRIVVEQPAVTDAAMVAAEDFLALLRNYLLDDTIAMQLVPEGVNVINPFVIVSSILASDEVALVIEEDTTGLPSLLTLFVDDEAAMQVDDVTLTENLELPFVVDFMIETDYRTTESPQSFQVLPSKFW